MAQQDWVYLLPKFDGKKTTPPPPTPSNPPCPLGGDTGSNSPPAKQLLTRAEAYAGLKNMVTRGRRPRVFVVEAPLPSDEDSINNLSGSVNGGGGGGSSVAATADGSGPTNLDLLFDAAAALSPASAPSPAAGKGGGGGGGRNGVKAASGKGGGADAGEEQDAKEPRADVGVLLRVMEEGVSAVGGVGPLEWAWLSGEEAAGRARKLYREAAHAQVLNHKPPISLIGLEKGQHRARVNDRQPVVP